MESSYLVAKLPPSSSNASPHLIVKRDSNHTLQYCTDHRRDLTRRILSLSISRVDVFRQYYHMCWWWSKQLEVKWYRQISDLAMESTLSFWTLKRFITICNKMKHTGASCVFGETYNKYIVQHTTHMFMWMNCDELKHRYRCYYCIDFISLIYTGIVLLFKEWYIVCQIGFGLAHILITSGGTIRYLVSRLLRQLKRAKNWVTRGPRYWRVRSTVRATGEFCDARLHPTLCGL